MKLVMYLFFPGNCAEAFDFYQSVFGTEPAVRMTFAEGPPDFGYSDQEKDRIMHTTLPIGESVLMGSDVPAAQDAATKPGGAFAVSIQVDDRAKADAFFAALTEGGSVAMPMQDMFWGAYFGMGADRFGVQWMVNCEAPAPR